MADNTINVRIKQKIDTESNWSKNNPILLKGEKGLIEGTGKYRIGDGTSKWSDLPLYEGMTESDRLKLDGIETNANNYSLPTASSSTLGGVKTTSTVTDTSEYSPCPIVSGVPYYRNTLAQKEYTLSNISGTLAVSKGGTGATSASTGRANIGAVNFVCQKEEPADGDQNVGDLWFAEK